VDEHQRRVWGRMVEVLDTYDAGDISLHKLVSDLQGLLGASDLHDPSVVSEFWEHFSKIEGEVELRTEPWAPPGLSTDESLRRALSEYRTWVLAILGDASSERI
jgi:hypothetical protein